MKKILFSSVVAICLLAACQSSTTATSAPSNANDSTAAINAISKADSLWDEQSSHNSVQGWLDYYTDDAIVLAPGEKACKDKASREAVIKGYFSLPAASMRFQASKIEVSKAGDFGYSTGAYQFSYKDPAGKEIRETGKFNETWKKQADGNWKCVLDIWNADPVAKS